MPEIKEYCGTLLEKNGYLDYIVLQLVFFLIKQNEETLCPLFAW